MRCELAGATSLLLRLLSPLHFISLSAALTAEPTAALHALSSDGLPPSMQDL